LGSRNFIGGKVEKCSSENTKLSEVRIVGSAFSCLNPNDHDLGLTGLSDMISIYYIKQKRQNPAKTATSTMKQAAYGSPDD
jgi:hypothetical protein